MKKYVLLFLALSSLSFAEVVITNGNNSNNGGHLSIGGAGTASIGITVTATVSDDYPSLEIVDESGAPVTSVGFNHVVLSGNAEVNQNLTANLRVKATASNAITIQTASIVTETHTLGGLTSTLSHTTPIAIVDSDGTAFSVTSTLTGNASAMTGTATAAPTNLNITYSKNDASAP